MGLSNNADSPVRGVHQEPRHGDLGPRMKVDLGLFDVNELSGAGSLERDHDRKRLGDPKSHVRDADQVMRSPTPGPGHAPDSKLNLCVVNLLRINFPSESELIEIFPQHLKSVWFVCFPAGNQARHIGLERSRKGWSN